MTQRGAVYLAGLLTSAEPSRAKLLEMQHSGIGLQHAAKLAGIAKSTCQQIRSGAATTISRDVETAILRVQKPYLAHGQKVSAWRFKRIIRALTDEQYTKQQIAHMAGLQADVLYRDHERITVDTHLKLMRVWARVSLNQID